MLQPDRTQLAVRAAFSNGRNDRAPGDPSDQMLVHALKARLSQVLSLGKDSFGFMSRHQSQLANRNIISSNNSGCEYGENIALRANSYSYSSHERGFPGPAPDPGILGGMARIKGAIEDLLTRGVRS